MNRHRSTTSFVPRLARLVAVLAALAPTSVAHAAQTAPKPAPPAAGGVSVGRAQQEAFGLDVADGTLWGAGPDYKVRFDAGGIEFTPALGRAAPRNLPLSLAVASIRRGDTLLWTAPAAGVAPVRAGNVVEYPLLAGVSERYEVQRGGVEQSFVFAAPLQGTGDLVVRLRVTTELPLPAGAVQDAVPGAALRFEQPGLGGVSVGAVTGVDAEGRTAAGAARWDAGGIELSLPGAFVAAARFPLVLDPLIQSVIPVATGSIEEGDTDVACLTSSGRYLVVWDKIYSISDIDIRGQTYDLVGNPDAFWIIEVAPNTLAVKPAVAMLYGHVRFMVVWEQRPNLFGFSDVHGCSISLAGFGKSSNIAIAAGGSVNHIDPDVGGHNKGEANVVSVVWEENGAIRHRNVFVPFIGEPGNAALIETIAFSDCSAPSISQSGGDTFQLLVAYTRWFGDPAPGDHDIEIALIDSGGGILEKSLLVSSIGPDERMPDVDGDGQEFLLAYTRAANVFAGLNSVYTERFTYAGVVLASYGPEQPIAADGVDNREPAVVDTGSGYLLAWSRQYEGSDYDIPVVAIDPTTGMTLGSLVYADFETTVAARPKVCSQWTSLHSAPDNGMCTWTVTYQATGDDDAYAALVDPKLGTVVNLGGQTAGGGVASMSPPVAGNASYAHFYDHAKYAFNPVTLIISVFQLGAPFCTGVLHPHPDFAFFVPLATNGNAHSEWATGIPADPVLIGLTLYDQWSESDLSGSPCGKKLQLSNGLKWTID